MINKDFLKNLTLLYVEDDEIARTKLAKILRRVFNNVLLASNGLEGYILFQKYQLEKNKIDIILSDINMPQMNGLEMFEKIKELDSKIPIIYTTARTESNELLKAIELHANHYILKPIDAEDVITRIQKVCEKIYYEDLILTKNRELEQFLGVIDHAALITKMNNKQEITYINSKFLDTLDCEKEEVLEKQFTEIVHKDTSKSVMDELWDTISRGKVWHTDIKYQDSNNEVFFVNSTIFQVIHDEGYEYINIGFLSTSEVSEKREFHKKIINNIKQTKLEAVQTNEKIGTLEMQLQNVKNNDIHQHELSADLKERNKTLLNQITFYEEALVNKDKQHEKSVKNTKVNLEKITGSYKRALFIIDNLKSEMKIMSDDEEKKKDEIIKLEDVIEEQRSVIRDLRDTLQNIDEDVKEEKKKSSFLDKLLS